MNVQVDEDRASLDTNESSRTTSYDILTVEGKKTSLNF